MAYIKIPRYSWLLVIIMAVWAAKQYTMNNNWSIKQKMPYLCDKLEPSAKITEAACCANNHKCDPTCYANGPHPTAIMATNATRVFGQVHVILGSDNVRTIQSVADLTTRRNFISSTLVRSFGLGGDVEKFAEVDIHPVDMFGRNVTVTEFVLLSIGVGIDDAVLTNKIFEVIPNQKGEEGFVTTNLLLGLDFLGDAGALGINQALFIQNIDR